MIKVRRASERGVADFGWLKSYHSFSFGDYFDPSHMGFSILRVINDDTFVSGSGFPTHSHRDMEIITFVLAGSVTHKDSTGSSGQTSHGEIQVMTAGSGISHSEFAVGNSNCEMLQIWLKPGQTGLTPSYRQINWLNLMNSGHLNADGGNIKTPPSSLHLLCSSGARNSSAGLHTDCDLYYADLQTGQGSQTLSLSSSRNWYFQGLEGSFRFKTAEDQVDWQGRDGIGFSFEKSDSAEVLLSGQGKFLLFDLPK